MKLLLTILSFFTGYAGLVYEVTWHRYLANLLGSQAQATAVILAVFLGGLAAGYGLFGCRQLRIRIGFIPVHGLFFCHFTPKEEIPARITWTKSVSFLDQS